MLYCLCRGAGRELSPGVVYTGRVQQKSWVGFVCEFTMLCSQPKRVKWINSR